MIVYGKEWDYDVFSCEYCLYWKEKERGCIYRCGCCCPVEQHLLIRNGVKVNYKSKPKGVSECVGCPYGKAFPCIGWCTRKITNQTRRNKI